MSVNWVTGNFGYNGDHLHVALVVPIGPAREALAAMDAQYAEARAAAAKKLAEWDAEDAALGAGA